MSMKPLQKFRLYSIAFILFAITACASTATTNSKGYVASEVEQRLTGKVYTGEWKPGFTYKITFKGVGREMTAIVFVVDSKAEYNMPAKVMVEGNNVDLRYTDISRVDKLVYDPREDRLDGNTFYKGNRKEKLTAKGT